ncbi:MAG: glycosyltransferase family 2 protein [Xanthomonadaceae bacterium]|nr:glycosyltransferase family 2 protein [Xanthomonadaceae bacterium]MDE1965015.1 glycosyltransferase family 2 protein [Xanthomonadaceae bacterium]
MIYLHGLFWLSAVALGHTFVGYPLWVVLRARWRPSPVRRGQWTPTVSAIVAVHNAGAQMEARLANLAALDYPPGLIDIVVVCDGCEDDSAARCRRFGDERVRVLEFIRRRGKAACLNDAIAAARGEVLLMLDVRQRLEPQALRELVANLADPEVGVVGGELCFEDPETGFARSVDAYWRYETLIRRSESTSGSMIGVSGALYAMRREVFQPLPEGTVLDDVLVPMRAARAGWRVVFEPGARAWDRPSTEPVQEQRRKIRTLAGNFQLVQLSPWLLRPGLNPLWFRFLSHKLLRLAAPWLVLVLGLTAAALATRHVWCALTLAALLAGVAMVLAWRVLPALGRLLPVRLSVAFFYMNAYAAMALLTFARNRRLHLW